MLFSSLFGSSSATYGSIVFGVIGGDPLRQSLSDSLTFAEFIHQPIDYATIADTLSFSDSLAYRAIFNQTLTSSVTFVDTFRDPLEDSVDFEDSISGTVWVIGTLSDALSLLESLLNNHNSKLNLAESINFVEALSTSIRKVLAFSDTLGFTDTVSGTLSRLFKDNLTFNETLTEYLAKRFIDVLTFTEQISTQNNLKRSIADNFLLPDSISLNIISRKTLSDTVLFTDTMVGNNVKALTDTLVYTDIISGNRSTPIKDTFTFVDSSTFNRSINLPTSDIVSFKDKLTPKLAVTRQLTDAISFLDTFSGVRARLATASDSFSFNDHLLRQVIEVIADDTLTFVEQLTCHKMANPTINEQLIFVEGITKTSTLHLGWSDYLLYSDGFLARIVPAPGSPGYRPGSGGRTSDPGPVLVPPPPLPPLPPNAPPVTDPVGVYLPPAVWQGVVAVLPQVVLTGLTRSIVLPPPEFNDFVANQDKMILSRSMTGLWRSYTKKASRDKLNWRFVIPKYKADEFKLFLKAEIDNPIKLIDFNGWYWNVKILSDSVDFNETRRWAPCGNAVDVTVELVGQRYA